MNESTLQAKLIKTLERLDACPVENPKRAGTPDINFIGGWMEVKFLPRWPKRDSTVVKLNHFTPQQKVWLWRRCQKGGKAWLFLQVESTYLLFCGSRARMVGSLNKTQLIGHADAVWEVYPDKELITWLNPKNP